MNSIVKTAEATAGSSSTVLSCGLWLAVLMFAIALAIEIKVLMELYKDKREDEEAESQKHQSPSEINKLIGSPLQSPGGNLGKLT